MGKNQTNNHILGAVLILGTTWTSFMLAVLEAVFQHCHDHHDIYKKIEDDYISDSFHDHEISSGGSAIEKNIAWAIWYLNRKGLLYKPERGWYDLTKKGLALLKAAPYYLEGGLEAKLDEKGILSGKALYDLSKHDDGTFGAATEAAYVREFLRNTGME